MTVQTRGGRIVLARMGVAGFVLAVSVPLSGQQQFTVASQPREEALKNNVRTYELALKNGVMSAGMKLQQWAQQIEPNVVLAFAAEPAVRSVVLPDDSMIFHVEVSEILPTSIALWSQSNRFKHLSGMNAPGIMAADPTRGASPVPLVAPSQEYTRLVREALVDTLLDSSGGLPLRTGVGQTLTVACNPVDVLQTSQLQRNPSKQLILTIKAEDLLAYRNQTTSKDEAKQRIVERRF